jgi:hypothetical protein
LLNPLDTTEADNSAGFARPASKRGGQRMVPAILVAGLALAVSGCALSMNEFAQNRELQGSGEPAALSGSSEFDTTNNGPPTAEALAAQATAVAESPTALAPTTVQADGSSNPSAAPAQSNSKLLTPEEKARVIAELEALASGQGASAPAAKATSNECDGDAAAKLESGCPTEQ